MDAYLKNLEKNLQIKLNGDVIPIPLVKGEKKPLYSHKTRTNDELWIKWRSMGVRMVLDGDADLGLLIRNNAMIVVDFDNKDQPSIFEENIPEFKDTVKQETKKGFHYFFKGSDETKNIFNQVRPFGDGIDIDIITTHEKGTGGIITIYPSDNKTWINDITTTMMLPMPSKFLMFYNEKRQSITKEKLVEDNNDAKQPTSPVPYDVLKEVVMNLNPTLADSYGGGWRDTTWAIMNVSAMNKYVRKGNNLIHEFSKQSNKYDEDAVEDFIQNSKAQEDGFGLGTLMKYLKESNEVVFNKIQLILNPIKKVTITGYSIQDIEEPEIDLRDGMKRDYATMKQIFEVKNFKVSGNKAMFVELKKINKKLVIVERTRKDLMEEYENLHFCVKVNETEQLIPFAKMWLKDVSIRTFDEFDFLPPPNVVSHKTFNTWKGFRAEKINIHIDKEERATLLKPIYDHLFTLCKDDEKSYVFVKKFIAQLIQEPGILKGYCLCFQSDEGTGKSTIICELLGKRIIGDAYYWETNNCVDDLFSKHACAFHNRLLVNIDEPPAHILKQNSDRFKSLITNSRQRLENKNKDIRQINSCARYIITTNNEDVLKISSNDRRFVIIECSDKLIGNTKYFDELYKHIDDPKVQRAFYDDMMEEDITNFDWRKERPITAAYANNLEACIEPHVRFMAGEVRMCEHCNIPIYAIRGGDLFKKFNKVLKTCQSSYSLEYITFNKKIAKLGGVEKKITMNGVEFIINIAEMKEYLKTKKKFNFNDYMFYDEFEAAE